MAVDDLDFFGPTDPVFSSSPYDTARIIDVAVTQLYRDSLYGKPRAVAVDQGTSGAYLRAALFSDSGAPLVIDVGSYSIAPTVEARYRESTGFVSSVTDATGVLSDDGRTVLVALPDEIADQPGVFTVQFRVVDSDNVERARNQFWTYVNRGLWTTDGGTGVDRGVPTTMELRNAVRDHPGVNRLLGDYEFDVAEMAMAVVSAVQTFDNEFPPINRHVSTTQWPIAWRQPLIDGTLARLFATAADYHRRGMLPYAAGGVSIDDLNKERSYLQASEMLRERYTKWCKMTRAKISVAGGFGSVGSGLGGY